MDDLDFDGTIVLERLAAIGQLDAFAEAVDAADSRRATELMEMAAIDRVTMGHVLRHMNDDS